MILRYFRGSSVIQIKNNKYSEKSVHTPFVFAKWRFFVPTMALLDLSPSPIMVLVMDRYSAELVLVILCLEENS